MVALYQIGRKPRSTQVVEHQAAPETAAARATRYGLVSAWGLADLSDSFGANTLTNNNTATFAAGKLGDAVQLASASSQYLSCADTAGLSLGNNDLWVAGWMNPAAITSRQTIASKGGATTATDEYVLEWFNSTNRFRFYVGDQAGASLSIAVANTFGAATGGNWHFVIAYHDSVNDLVGISINGGAFDTVTTAGRTPPDTTNAFRIGRGTGGNTNYMNGAIDAAYLGKSPVGGVAGVIEEIRDFLYNSSAGREYADWDPVEPAAEWATSGSLTGISLSPLVLTPTYQNVGFELPFTESAGTITDVTAEFRPVGGSARTGLPAWVTRPASDPAAYGSCLDLEPGTDYEVRATVTDGVGAVAYVYGTVTTRADDLPAALSLTPTHFVRADGSDLNTGTVDSAGGAWATIAKAIASAPSGAIVQVGPGYFVGQSTVQRQVGRATPITFLAQHPALDDSQSPINPGNLTIIEGLVKAGPSGNGVITEAPWVATDLTGPVDGLTHTVWKWTGAGATALFDLGWGATRDAMPRRAIHWFADSDQLTSAAAWAEIVQTNRTYRAGFIQFGSDLYLQMADATDPNTLWWSGGTGAGFSFSAADCRVSGFVIRGYHIGIQFSAACDGAVSDHNDIQNCTLGHYLWATDSDVDQIESALIERNYLRSNGFRSQDQVADPTVPWNFVKINLKLADGTVYAHKVGSANEGAGVYSREARGVVVRHNTIEGMFNGISAVMNNASSGRYGNVDWDVHDNVIRDCPDDPIEPEADVAGNGAGTNWRCWHNTIIRCTTFLSTAPISFGPMYLWSNTAWRTGTQDLAADLDGVKPNVSSLFFKYSASGNPHARIYVINNTFWTDDAGDDGTGFPGGSNFGGGSITAQSDAFYLRNNLFRCGRNGFEYFAPSGGSGYDEDYNQFATFDATRGMKLLSPSTTDLTFAAYQARSGQGAHSNAAIDLHDTATLDAQFVDASSGDLTLVLGSVLRGIGAVVPGLALAGASLGYQP